nr:chemotaxis protein CheW [uncultured Desulfobacter sp.]
MQQTTDNTGKYLIFSLSDESYGISIQNVKEIIGMMPITSIPKTGEWIKGVINLRGKIIPIIDLRIKFSMEPIPYSDRTCIIIVEIGLGKGTAQTGIVVDGVSEVLHIKDECIDPPPSFGTRINTDTILGMAKMKNGVKILLNIDQVGPREVWALGNAA